MAQKISTIPKDEEEYLSKNLSANQRYLICNGHAAYTLRSRLGVDLRDPRAVQKQLAF